MRAELRGRVDLLLLPDVGRSARLQHHRVLHDEEVALLIADRALGPVGAPDVLDRVPLEAALPGDVDDGGRVPEPGRAFVALAREDLRAPFPADELRALPQSIGDLDGERDRLEGRAVDRPDVRSVGILDQLVVADRARVALHHPERMHVQLRLGERWPGGVRGRLAGGVGSLGQGREEERQGETEGGWPEVHWRRSLSEDRFCASPFQW